MSGNLALGLLILSVFYSIGLNILYFTKKHISTDETKIFSILLSLNLVGLLLEIMCILSINNLGISNIVSILINKVFLEYHLLFTYIIFVYVCLVIFKDNMNDKKRNIIKNLSIGVFVILFIAILCVPVVLHKSVEGCYSSGPAVDIIYNSEAFAFILVIFLLVKNYKFAVKSKKKLYPMLVFIVGMSIVSLIQKNNPFLTLSTEMETFLIFLMFNTIENPDVKMLEQMELARDQADKANKAKTDFLSSMSHEIRTPLNAIVGFSDCIMDATSLEEAKENAKDIVSASDTLLEIVNGILDISKIEAGKLEIINSPYDAGETFLELAKLITPKMKEKGLDFTYQIAPDLPKTLYGDHANLKKIVTNLLSNACKYTEKGFVHYEVNCINSGNLTKLIISVEDSGRGIKKDSVDKMFTKFQRLDEDRNTTIEGTGLGLAITKQLIELMGGKIIVHTVYGEGSKFTVVLNQRIEAVELKEKKKAKTTLDLHDVRILIVDDTPLNLKVSCKLLQKYGANQIVTADSGFECFQRIRKGEVYDVILLDDMMPKMSGVETLKKMKELPGFKIPTVALTANAITGMREKYLADGFDDFLAKPIEKNQMIEVLNQILGRNVTEEIAVDEVQKVIESPAIRGDVIPDVEDYDKAEEERNKIIPVEDNIEEILGDKLDRSYVENEEEIETLEVEENSKPDLIPVVDIDTPVEKEKVYDREYLESMGVDVNHALELLGDMEMFNSTIKDFYNDVEEKWKKINEYKDSNNMSEYAILVHSLKSDCKYLGFMTLADIAYQHELKSKENDSDYVNNNFNKLEEEYNKVLSIVQNYVKYQNI